MSAHISPFWCTWKKKTGKKKKEFYSQLTNTHIKMHTVTWSGLSLFYLLASGEQGMPQRSQTGGIRNIYHISSLWQQTRHNESLFTTMVGAVACKTKAALYVEVEPAHWERGSHKLCADILMTGIHGQCQIQVERWMVMGGRINYCLS